MESSPPTRLSYNRGRKGYSNARRSLGRSAPGSAAPIEEKNLLAIEAEAKIAYDSFKSEKSGEDAVVGQPGHRSSRTPTLSSFSRQGSPTREANTNKPIASENECWRARPSSRGRSLDRRRGLDEKGKEIEKLFASKEYFDFWKTP